MFVAASSFLLHDPKDHSGHSMETQLSTGEIIKNNATMYMRISNKALAVSSGDEN